MTILMRVMTMMTTIVEGSLTRIVLIFDFFMCIRIYIGIHASYLDGIWTEFGT